MRIRYAYKLTSGEGTTSFVVLNHKKSEEEVLNELSAKGIVEVVFHDRVRTGFRLDANGELVPTGLTQPKAEEVVADATPKAPKAKKSTKKSK